MQLTDLFNTTEVKEKTCEEIEFYSICQRIKDVVDKKPDEIALADKHGYLSYAEFWQKAQELACFIKYHTREKEPNIAIMTDRSRYQYIATLATWLSGANSLSLDANLPLSSLGLMLDACNPQIILLESIFAYKAERLALEHKKTSFPCKLICIDKPSFTDSIDGNTSLMNKELWDMLTKEKSDASWKSYFTKDKISNKDLQGMADNVVNKLNDYIANNKNLLDIGGASGLVAQTLVKALATTKNRKNRKNNSYTSVDISKHEVSRIRQYAKEQGLENHGASIEARDINLLGKQYDIIVMNSVAENFSGYNYLRLVLNYAYELLHSEEAVFFIGMIWDFDKKDTFAKALKECNYPAFLRFNQAEELLIPKSFFMDWAKDFTDIELIFSRPNSGLAELDDYRYDLLIKKSKTLQKRNEKEENYLELFGINDIQDNFKSQDSILENTISPDTASSGTAAYIIYTSGSTAKPKAILMEHGGLANLMSELIHQAYVPLEAKIKQKINSALLSSFSFDASMQSWATFCCGGTLFIISEDIKKDPEQLHRHLVENSIHLCDGTPSIFSLLLDYWESKNVFPKVGTWILGGEVLTLEHLRRFFTMNNQENSIIINAYGPTECCVDTSLYEFNKENWEKFPSPPLGLAIKNMSMQVCDDNGNTLQDGLPGELWISGIGLARGYLNNQEATDKAFVYKQNTRFYRSGDIVCKRNGLFFYIKREDGQVKINGHRVEVAEIERALFSSPLVKQALVIASNITSNTDNTNSHVLIAYISYNVGYEDIEKSDENIEILKKYLLQSLPYYFIPHFFIPISTFPLTPSGKIDKKSLPSPHAYTHEQRKNTQECPPKNEIEKKLAILWGKLLGRDVNERNADFFYLGGHSILAVRLLSLIENTFNRKISLSSLFKNTTIAKQAELLTPELLGTEQEDCNVQIIKITENISENKPNFFLFHPAGGSAFCYKVLGDFISDTFNVYAVEPPPLSSRESFFSSVEDMAIVYSKAISELIGENKKYFLGGWSFGGILALESARHLRNYHLKEEALIIIDTMLYTQQQKELVFLDDVNFLMSLLGENLLDKKDIFYALAEEKRLDFLVNQGIETGRLPSGFSKEHMQSLISTFRANALAGARYSPKNFNTNTLLIRAKIIDRTVDDEKDISLGWNKYMANKVAVEWVDGSHETILYDAHAKQMGLLIKRYVNTL